MVDNERWYAEIGPGWRFLIDAVITLAGNNITILQVKEKFGELRIYYKVNDGLDERQQQNIRGIVSRAEYLSLSICEETGKPGKLRDINGYLKTLCDEEYEKAIA